jgi:hypothetical protein
MNNARLRLAFVGRYPTHAGRTSRFSQTLATHPLRGQGASRLPPRAPFFLRARGDSQKLGEPPGSPRSLPLVRCADKALRAFPMPLPAHRPTEVGL